MTATFEASPLLIAAAAAGLCGIIFIVAGLAALIRLRPLRFAVRTLIGLVLLTLGGVAGVVTIGPMGYRALTHEEVAARVVVEPVALQRFTATFFIPDRPQMKFDLAGDGLYVDAHILKWKSAANLVGLHTAYELDRVAGRYDDVMQ